METSEWLQVIAGFGTFFVIIIGVTFAALELRQEAHARRLQGMASLFSEVWPVETYDANRTLIALPDNFDPAKLTSEQTQSILVVVAAYTRLGFFLENGLVKEREIFNYPAFGVGAIYTWEKVRHFVRDSPTQRLGVSFWIEYLAQRAQNYWLKNKGKHIAETTLFEPDFAAVTDVMQQAQAARRPAKGAVEPEAAS